MTKEQAKEFYPIMQAFAEGRVIECRTRTWELNKGWQYSTNWKETEELKFQDTYEYRIKPEPKYRPFKDKEECWQEMDRHQHFGWVKDNKNECFVLVSLVNNEGVLTKTDAASSFDYAIRKYSFVDGTPFGIKEEE